MRLMPALLEDHIRDLPEDRKDKLRSLYFAISEALPTGFEATIQYKMISFVVPKTIYPAGYHVDPKLALPFVSIASQKNYISVYHLGIYGKEELLAWFQEEFRKRGIKVDMGKSCIRFNPKKEIPYDLIGELSGRMTVEEWIKLYEESMRAGKSA